MDEDLNISFVDNHRVQSIVVIGTREAAFYETVVEKVVPVVADSTESIERLSKVKDMRRRKIGVEKTFRLFHVDFSVTKVAMNVGVWNVESVQMQPLFSLDHVKRSNGGRVDCWHVCVDEIESWDLHVTSSDEMGLVHLIMLPEVSRSMRPTHLHSIGRQFAGSGTGWLPKVVMRFKELSSDWRESNH